MDIRFRRIAASDRDLHGSLLEHVEALFHAGEHFRRWIAQGAWNDDYEVFAAIGPTGRILATVGRMRMCLVVAGAERRGWQLATVGTREAERGRGLARRLLDWTLREARQNDLPVILFANDGVRDFYPRFGFRPVRQWQFTAACAVNPAAHPAPRLDYDREADRAVLFRHAANAAACGSSLSARDYAGALAFHLVGGGLPIYWFEDLDTILIASVKDRCLRLHGMLATRPCDLRTLLPRLVTGPVETIAFGFDPAGLWPAPVSAVQTDESLFVSEAIPSPAGPFRFPDLAQT